MKPQRIQRKRTKGWRLPEGAIIVTRPTKWGNPIPVETLLHTGEVVTPKIAHDMAVILYQHWLTTTEDGRLVAEAAKRELRGHDLACFCRLDEPCHADVLLRIANEEN